MRKTFKMLAAGAVAAAMLVGVSATAANAVDQTDVDLNAIGSITIHKYAQLPKTGEIGEETNQRMAVPIAEAYPGDELDPGEFSNHTPLEGVQFTVAPIEGIAPLNTTEGWVNASELTIDSNGNVGLNGDLEVVGLGTTVGPIATDADGLATFANLPVGAYLVKETSPGDNQVVAGVEPFIMTIPSLSSDNTWNYDVHAYPKNAVTAIDKSVNAPNGLGLGSQVSWPLNIALPVADTGYTRAVVTDELDSRLQYVSVSDVNVTGTGVDIDLTPEQYSVTVTGQQVVFEVTDLTTINAGLDLTLSFNINTNVIGVGSGVINNTATVQLNDLLASTNTPNTKWGAAVINKTDPYENVLAGATFSFYATQADALAEVNPISVNGQTRFTSDAEGNAVVAGLFVGDSNDNTVFKQYWFKEVEAPQGYTILTDAYPIFITPDDVATADVTTAVNFPIGAGTLPTTGAQGVLFFAAGGLLLLMAGVGVYFVSRRGQKASA